MKKALVALLAVLLCLTLFAGALAQEEKIVIGQVFWGLHDSYQHAHQVQTQKYLEELGIEYIPIDGQMKPEVQTAAMEDLIARGVDGIICQAYDQASMELSIQMAQDAGIPVVSFVNVAAGDVLYPSVEISEEAGAIEMGRIVGEKFRRRSGFQIKLGPSSTVVEWAHNHARSRSSRALQEMHPDLEHVFTAASPTARSPTRRWRTCCCATRRQRRFGYDAKRLGAMAALEAAGRARRELRRKTEMVASVDGRPEISRSWTRHLLSRHAALRPRENARACVDLKLKVIPAMFDMRDNTQNIKFRRSSSTAGHDIEATGNFMLDEWTSCSDTSRLACRISRRCGESALRQAVLLREPMQGDCILEMRGASAVPPGHGAQGRRLFRAPQRRALPVARTARGNRRSSDTDLRRAHDRGLDRLRRPPVFGKDVADAMTRAYTVIRSEHRQPADRAENLTLGREQNASACSKKRPLAPRSTCSASSRGHRAFPPACRC